ERGEERAAHRRGGEPARAGLAEATAEHHEREEAGQGQCRDEPDEFEHGVRSAFEERQVVGGGVGPTAHDGHDDGEADHDLCSRHDENEQHDGLAVEVAQDAGEGDEAEAHGIEHQLDAHEHDERVAPHEQTDAADGEEQRRQHEVPGAGDDHQSAPFSASTTSGDRASSGSMRPALRTIHTAPTTAMVSSSAVASRANTWVVNRLRPIETMSGVASARGPSGARAPVMPSPPAARASTSMPKKAAPPTTAAQRCPAIGSTVRSST